MMLSSVPSGKMVSIIGMKAENGFRGRLLSLGFVPGTKIEIVRGGAHSAFIVGCRGSRLIIGRELADRIQVSE